MAGSVGDPSSSAVSLLSRRRDLRSQSFSSDRGSVSTLNYGSASLPSVAPEAAFINESSASQIISNSYDASASTWYDQNGIEPSAEPVQIAPAALQLVNGFLDQLLFNFLQAARSTSLAALRPAVGEVLKPKLARETILNANEELREYLGDADEDEYVQPSPNHGWDLELAWKRARLRCMVYSSLGELEEEDEDLFMQQENLETLPNQKSSEIISAAVAIFLTSVIEYMGELTLTSAGQSAFQRMQAKAEKAIKNGTHKPSDLADCIVVEEKDMERVAFDRTLGRLWRAWKKKLRSPSGDSPPVSFTGISSDSGDADSSRRGSPPDGNDEAGGLSLSEIGCPSPEGSNSSGIELYGSDPLSEDESELATREFLTLARRRPVSLGDTPTYVSGLQIATIAERHPAVLMLHRRFSMPSPRAPHLYRDVTRPRTFNKSSILPEARFDVLSEVQTEAQVEAQVGDLSSNRRRLPTAGIRDSFGNGKYWESDDVLEQATYEKAEIVKSSRVSVASISSRSVSDSVGAVSARRVSTDHSARIIDVSAPKSPVHSHRQSVDAPAERSRPPSGPEEHKTRIRNPVARSGASETPPKSTSDIVRSGLPSASIISESDEEVEERISKAPKTIKPATSAQPREPSSRVLQSLPTGFEQADRKIPSPKADAPPPPISKVAVQKGPHVVDNAGEDCPPEVPRKPTSYPARQSSKAEGKNMALVERTKSKEVEEEGPIPLHSAVPPRPIHTSGSCGSTGPGRPKAFKEESSSRAESVARNFEELIQSNQTISYTLTPENMRDINVKPPTEGSVVSKIRRKSEDLRSPSSEATGSPLTRRATQGLSSSSTEVESRKPSGPVPRAPPGLAFSTSRYGGPQARDARVTGESLADFAEFIKFTGPMDKAASSVRNSSVPPGVGRRDVNRRVSTASSHSNHSSNSRHRYRSRDSFPEVADNMDIVPQIPSQAAGAQHRIPRHVAPFRTTMDSDQFNGVAGGKAVDAFLPDFRHSQGSSSLTESNVLPSTGSATSTSALIKKAGSERASKAFSDEDMAPMRRRRPARDPYAIDGFSDGEDLVLESRPAVPRKKEESLAEFLRNYSPPPQEQSQPVQAKPSKKARGSGLMGRFSRGGSKDIGEIAGKEGPGTSSGSNAQRPTSSKHVPLVVNMPPGYDKYGPIPGYFETANAAAVPRAPLGSNEPRDRLASPGEASDMGDYLRRSTTSGSQGPSSGPSRHGDGNGFSKGFGRPKKTTST